MVKPCTGCHGIGPDDNTGYVGQGLLLETSSPLHTGNHQKMSGKGMLSRALIFLATCPGQVTYKNPLVLVNSQLSQIISIFANLSAILRIPIYFK